MIIFFRHGKTVWNLEKRLQGREGNSDLLPVDTELIKNIHSEYMNVCFEKVLISPSKRAQDYSKILNLKSNQTITVPELDEISFGIFSGCRLDEIDKDLIAERNRNKWNFRPEKGESYSDLYERLKNISDELNPYLYNSAAVAIIGHETTNKVLIGRLMNFKKEIILNMKQLNETIYKICHGILYKKNYKEDKQWEKL